MDDPELPYSLMAELGKVQGSEHPPVHLWHPDINRDIDLVISCDGVWKYLGTPIKRPRLVRLFASVLRRDGDDYYLVTPVEKCRITVEDVPFQAVLMDVTGEGESTCLELTTDMGEVISINDEHPLRIAQDGAEWIPYVVIRDDMEGRLNRNVYYQLADLMIPGKHPTLEGEWLGVWSHENFFPMLPV
jgi:hypothetical protein